MDNACQAVRHLNAARRYGYRGSHALRDYLQPRAANALRTLRKETPTFLQPHVTLIDEWTPTIIAAPQRLREPLLSSPKLWPSNTEYVEGFKVRRRTNHFLFS